MEKNSIFLIVTWNKYPEEDAGAVRQHAFAKNLSDIGYRPIVVGMGRATGFKKCVYDGIEYYSMRFKKTSIFFRVLGRFLFFYNTQCVLHKYLSCGIAGILLVSGDKNTFKIVERFATKNSIPLYHDSVEWYSACEFKKGTKDSAYIHNNRVNTEYIDTKYKVFAISSYLEKHFKDKGITTVRIPVIMDTNDYQFNKTSHGSMIKFLYAGSMGGKDKIKEFIDAICCLTENERKNIEFNILGITYEQFEREYGLISKEVLNNNIFFRGRVTRSQVLDYLADTDFTVLLRPEKERYAKAGFPTKVVESLAMSTPVMCNYSSDLELYLKDGINAIILKEPTCDECQVAIKHICSLQESTITSMKKKSRQTAVDFFDRRNYLDAFKSILF